jgi:hypothetical protein
MSKADHLFTLAQALADERPYVFEIRGPSVGDHDTADFMKELRSCATKAFELTMLRRRCVDQTISVLISIS